jgi:hypothetical protein
MKTVIIQLAVIFGIITCLTTCKKYPEGGFQKRGPKNIIGDWKLSLYEVNGIDSTDLINYNGDDNYKKCTFLKHHKKDSEIIVQIEGKGTSKTSFDDDNSAVVFYSESGNAVNCEEIYCNKDIFTPEGGYTQKWQINKLTKTELKISCFIKKHYNLIFLKN